MKQLFDSITCNEPKRLMKPVIWNVLTNLTNLLPFLSLAYIISQIYGYYVTGNLNRNFFGGVGRYGGLLYAHMAV